MTENGIMTKLTYVFFGHFKTTPVCDRGLSPQNRAPSFPKLNYEAL